MPTAPEHTDRSDRLDFIQALRGIAALAVVMFHARWVINGPAYLDLGDRLFASGFCGVDLFFVISGFIMVHTTWNTRAGGREAARFLLKRLARIWPVYVIATIVMLFATGIAHQYLATGPGLIAMAKAFAFYPQKIDGAPFFGSAPNGVGWTLNYEVWFYVLFGVSMLAGRARWLVLGALFVVFAVVVPEVMTGGVSTNAYTNYSLRPAILNLAASPMTFEFLAGVAIGLFYKSRFRIRDRPLALTIGALGVTAALWQFLSGYRGGHGPLAAGLSMIAMVLALAVLNKQQRIVVPRWLIWLGDISFSLYLVHRIPQLGLPMLLSDPKYAPLLAGGGVNVLVTTALALILAYWSWRLLERGLAERFRVALLRLVPRDAAQLEVRPPSTTTTEPVVNDETSDSK